MRLRRNPTCFQGYWHSVWPDFGKVFLFSTSELFKWDSAIDTRISRRKSNFNCVRRFIGSLRVRFKFNCREVFITMWQISWGDWLRDNCQKEKSIESKALWKAFRLTWKLSEYFFCFSLITRFLRTIKPQLMLEQVLKSLWFMGLSFARDFCREFEEQEGEVEAISRHVSHASLPLDRLCAGVRRR